MFKKDILYLNVENVFSTGILQSMVVRPALELHKKFGYSIGFTSMYRHSEINQNKESIPASIPMMSGRRSEKGFSLENVVLHFLFMIQVLLQSRHFKILHCRSYIATLIGLTCKRVWRQQVIFDVRGYLIDEAVESGRLNAGSLKYRILKKMEAYLFMRADVIIAVSEAMTLDIAQRFSRKAITLRNPADIPLNGEGPSQCVQKVITYNGSLNEWHLPELFFATIKQVSKKDPEYLFRIITSDIAKAETLALQHGLSTAQLLIKKCKASEVISELRGGGLGWCVIRPSFSKSVCWPVKFNEYLAANLPVIVNSGIGDLEALVKRYDLGLVVSVVDSAKAIADSILLHVAQRESFHVCPELARMVSWETQIKSLDECYQKLSSGTA
jgi:glycosyltransferase involved in cell wall biosynthesis